jgi:protocatechuate 3,4-dioxygenase beta subunit
MTVTGRVIDPAGKPAAGVPVNIIGQLRAPPECADERTDCYALLGDGATDADGRIQLDTLYAEPARFYDVYALVGSAGPGTGFGCMRLQQAAGKAAADIRLRHEQIIRGKLVDIHGQPAAGVEIQLHHVFSAVRLPGLGSFDGIGGGFNHLWTTPPEELRAWPRPVTTDEQGRFTLAGIGRGLTLRLEVRDPRFALQRFDVQTDDGDGPLEITLGLEPAMIIKGRALAADTGQPFPVAVIAVRSTFRSRPGMFHAKFRADRQGRFQVNPFPGDSFRIAAFPPAGEPYPARGRELAWPKGAIQQEIDVTLGRGVLIHGTVVEEGNGRPVAGASVQFIPMKRPDDLVFGWEAIVNSKDDGAFRIAVPPGQGYVLIVGPTLDYVPKEIGDRTLYENGRPGGIRSYAHDIIAYEVEESEGTHELTATVRRGNVLHAHVAGPQGQAVEDAMILTRHQIDPVNLTWLGHHFLRVRAGRLELHGLDPETPSLVYLLDAEHEWGAALLLSGNPDGEQPTIHLQPCGQARARFVGPDGRPVAHLELWPYVELVMTPGSHPLSRNDSDRAELAADSVVLRGVDYKHYGNSFATDDEGLVTLPGLIPGALYRVSDYSTNRIQEKGTQLRRDFSVRAGEILDLGDILVERPHS